MATNVLVSSVIEEIRFRLDHPTFTSTTHITSTAVLNLVQYSARRLSGIIRRTDSDYFTTQANLTTQAGINLVSLPANFTDLKQIAWLRSSSDSVPLERASVDQYLDPSEDVRAWSGAPLYRLQANALTLYPTPDQAYTLSIVYDTGIFVSATGDTIACQPGWEEWIVLDCCIRARQREEKDASDFIVMLGKVEADIVKQASTRDRFRTAEIRDLWDGGEWVDSRSLYVRR